MQVLEKVIFLRLTNLDCNSKYTLLAVNATMGLIDDCIECFSTRCFYEVLKISKDAVDTQIKKSYRKISLKVHPDRASATDKELATTKFQVSNIIFIPFFQP